jgi:nucleotide-binding universal stress UspA family protein
MLGIHHILVPTDGSAGSDAAAAYACDLAVALGARLTLLHVFTAPTVLLPDAVYAATPEELRPLEEACLAKLRGLADELARPELAIDVEAVEGNPTERIVETAKLRLVDLIIMGTHGRTGLSHLLLGSVAERVIRSAPCPVLTVRTAFKAGEREAA